MKTYPELLKVAIGERTLKQFSDETGIAQSHLSRMLNDKAPNPKPETLERISKASEGRVSLESLLEVFGYDLEAYKAKKASSPDYDRAKREVRSLLQGFDGFVGQKWGSVAELVEMVYMIYSEEHTKFVYGEEKSCTSDVDPNAESMLLLKGTADLAEHQACLYILLSYSVTRGGAIVFSKATSEVGKLKSAGVLPKDLDRPEVPLDAKESFTLYLPKALKEREMEAIWESLAKVTGGSGDKYISTLTGIGFVVSDQPDPEIVKRFMAAHGRFLGRFDKQDLERYVAGDMGALHDIGDSRTGAFGWGAAVSNVINAESKFVVGFWTQDDVLEEFKFENNPSCVFVSTEYIERNDLSVNEVMDVLEPYAREIGAEKIETCYFQSVFDKVEGECRYLS